MAELPEHLANVIPVRGVLRVEGERPVVRSVRGLIVPQVPLRVSQARPGDDMTWVQLYRALIGGYSLATPTEVFERDPATAPAARVIGRESQRPLESRQRFCGAALRTQRLAALPHVLPSLCALGRHRSLWPLHRGQGQRLPDLRRRRLRPQRALRKATAPRRQAPRRRRRAWDGDA